MKADGERIDGNRRRPPLPPTEHPRLVMLGDRLLTAFADIGGRFRPAGFPAQACELEPLILSAVRTRHEVAPLVLGAIKAEIDAVG